MDEHTESRIREELHRAVGHLQVSPDLWARIRSRHRREPRQRMFAVATSLALLAIVVVAAVPVIRDAARKTPLAPTTTTAKSEVPAPGEPVPPDPELSLVFGTMTRPGVMITSGQINDRTWMFVFFDEGEGGDGWVCLGWLHGRGVCFGESGSAAPLAGSAVFVGGYGSNADGSLLHGVVSKDVARVRVELPDAQGQVVETRPVGQEAGLAVNFFVVMFPGGTSLKAAEVTAYDAAGRVLGTATGPE